MRDAVVIAVATLLINGFSISCLAWVMWQFIMDMGKDS